MNKYSALFQVCAILFIIFIIYLLFRFIITLVKKNRLSYYSISIEKDKFAEDSFIFKIVHKFGNVLKSMVIFDGLAKTYDKYSYNDDKFNNGMDFVSFKILLGFIFVFLYFFISFLYKKEILALMILVTFVLGFILIDFYCIYLRNKNRKVSNKEILSAVIIMNNSFKANRSTEQAILDVIDKEHGVVNTEFKKVYNDIKIGLSFGEAFKRMYFRTGNKTIIRISNILSLITKTGVSRVEVFDDIEKTLVEEEKVCNELDLIKGTNKLALVVFLILPLVFICYSIALNDNYVMLFTNVKGIFVALILIIIYLLYVFMMFRVVKGDKNDK